MHDEGSPPSPIIPFGPGQAHGARLNGFRLDETIGVATNKLLQRLNTGRADELVLRLFKFTAACDGRELQAQVRALRKQVAADCRVATTNVVLRHDPQEPAVYYFVAPRSCRIGKLVTSVDEEHARRAFELALESLLLRDAGLFSGRLASVVGPRGRAARPYMLVSTRTPKASDRHYLNCLEVDFDLDRYGQLVVDARRRVFRLPAAGPRASTISPVAVGDEVAALALLDSEFARQVDARKRASRDAIPEITLEVRQISQSRWYAISELVGVTRAHLAAAGVRFEDMEFTATHYLFRSYIKPEHLEFPPRLTVVLAPGLRCDLATKALLRNELQALVDDPIGVGLPIDWIAQATMDPDGPLAPDRAYLFLNQVVAAPPDDDAPEDEGTQDLAGDITVLAESEDKDAGSCTIDGVVADPEAAFVGLARGTLRKRDVDFYTRVKYANLVSAKRVRACFQGMDVRDNVGELLDSPKLRKAMGELALKWVLVNGRLATTTPLPEVRMCATYTRAGRIRRDIGLEAIATVDLRVEKGGRTLRLQTSRVPSGDHDGIARKLEKVPLLRKNGAQDDDDIMTAADGTRTLASGLRDAVFLLELLDAPAHLSIEEGICLVVYDGSTVRIPRIIGPSGEPLLHERLDALIASLPEGQKSLPRGKHLNLLPYYIEGFAGQHGRGDYLYVESRNECYVRYFVPPVNPLAPSFGFSRFYDIMLYHKNDAKREHPLPINVLHPAVQVYFSLMTQDVVRLVENGKHTLLRKLAGLALTN